MPRVRMQAEPLSPDDAWPDRVAPTTGAVTVYVGTVRELDEGRHVEALHVEAFAEMATRELERLCDDAVGRFDLDDVRIVHRTGRIPAGQPILVVAVHGPHRKQTFAAVEYVMDELKTRAPIWKQEAGPEGRRWILGPSKREAIA